jgi:1-phosphofructokinase
MTDVTIFVPSPALTVTVESHAHGEEVHVHAGGQGVWQARMLVRFGLSVTTCSVLTGEAGALVGHLLEDQGIEVVAVRRDGRGPTYIQDKRGEEPVDLAQEIGDPLRRHELDELYSDVIGEGLKSRLVILSGPVEDNVLPADTYRRLAADLRQTGCRVVVDLAGELMAAAVAGGVDVLKVSDDELRDAELLTDDSLDALLRVMRDLRDRGAEAVIVTRAADSLVLLDESGFLEVTPPQLQATNPRGAGDSLTAGVVAGLAHGESVREAITLGAAAGALNVTRHGLGTGDPDAIRRLRTTVGTRKIPIPPSDSPDDPDRGRATPDGQATTAGSEDPS